MKSLIFAAVATAAAAATCLAASGEQASLPALRTVRVIEVTDGSVEYRMPVWSPDSRKIAFTGQNFRGIYVKDADGSGPVRAIPNSDSIRCLHIWAPDSRALLCEVRTTTQGWCLGRIDVETDRVEVLAGPIPSRGQIGRNSYGDITFTVRKKMETFNYNTGEMDKSPYEAVKILDRATGRILETYEYYSSQRPVSGEVRLEMDYRANKLWVVKGEGGDRIEFPHRALLATLSPTRDKVVFIPGDGNIYVSALDGSSMVSVGRGDSWDWSPDGRRLAYVGAIEQSEYNVIAGEIFVVNADGTGTTQMTFTSDIVEGDPTWSPDGTKIAYSAWNTRKIYVAILEEVK